MLSLIIYYIDIYTVNNSNSISDGFWSSSNNLGSYIIGILVFISCGLITFSIKEFYKKPPSFSGTFHLKLKTLESSYNPYKNLESFYILTIINDSNTKSIGRIEKTYDIEPNGNKRVYVGKKGMVLAGWGTILIEYLSRETLKHPYVKWIIENFRYNPFNILV